MLLLLYCVCFVKHLFIRYCIVFVHYFVLYSAMCVVFVYQGTTLYRQPSLLCYPSLEKIDNYITKYKEK